MATTTIYLSSTYEDLKDYRRAVFETLQKAGHDVIGMEDYVATDRRSVDKCLKDVEKADSLMHNCATSWSSEGETLNCIALVLGLELLFQLG